jgi:hypothetical protein
MAKQRQKRKSSKKRLNPLERKRIEAGMKEATSKITALSSDQVAPVVSKVRKPFQKKSVIYSFIS